MPNYPRRAPGKAQLLLSLCLAGAGSAHALGLGSEFRLHSALNQPLHAELALHLAPNEAPGEVQVRLADRDAYRRLGLFFHEGMPPLSFLVTQDTAGRPVIKVSSREAVREPAVELLLDVRWQGGRMVRQYALLLDPPALFTPPESVAPPVPVQAKPPAARPAAAAPREAIVVAGAYGPVQRGETLSQIALRTKPAGVSMAQMTVALFEANPHAFIGGDMNRLRWGVTLHMPTPAAIAAHSRGAASRMLLQAQQPLAERKETAAVAAPVAEPSAAPMLQILTPAAPDSASGELQQRLDQVRELNNTAELENEELRGRLAELEQQTRSLARQVLAVPESTTGMAPVAPPVEAAAPVAAAPAETTAPAGLAIAASAPTVGDGWWRNPSWWVAILAVLLGLGVALLGTMVWRRSLRGEYRDLTLALREDAEAKERARQVLMEKARHRLQ